MNKTILPQIGYGMELSAKTGQDALDEPIAGFLRQQTCATLCVIGGEGRPLCFSCFYAVNCAEGLLYFKSSADTRHSKMMTESPCVAGTVQPDRLSRLMVKGIQFEAIVLDDVHPLALGASAYYHKKNPLALAMPGRVWTLQINHIKMTDSFRVFGKKTVWDREAGGCSGLTINKDKNIFK